MALGPHHRSCPHCNVLRWMVSPRRIVRLERPGWNLNVKLRIGTSVGTIVDRVRCCRRTRGNSERPWRDKPYIEVAYQCWPRGGPKLSNVCCYSQRESPLISTQGSIARLNQRALCHVRYGLPWRQSQQGMRQWTCILESRPRAAPSLMVNLVITTLIDLRVVVVLT